MRTLLTECLAILMTFTLVLDINTRLFVIQETAYADSRQTFQLSAENENLTEFEIPAEGDGPVINRYTAHAGEPMEVSVLVTLTIDEKGNIVG